MEIIDHYYHYLSQEMDADLIAEQMTSLQPPLLNQDDITFIMTASNQYHKSCCVLEKVRVMDLGSLTTFCKLLESFDHQKHMGTLLLNGKSYKLNFDMPLCTFSCTAFCLFEASEFGREQPITMQGISDPQARKRPLSLEHPAPLKQLKQSKKGSSILMTPVTDSSYTEMDTLAQHPDKLWTFKPMSISTEFLNIKHQLLHILQFYDTKAMIEKCESLMASSTNSIPLFSSIEIQKLKQCKQAPQFIQALSPYNNWSNHSVLHEVVSACNNPVALNLLEQFDSQVDLSLPYADYPIPQPSPKLAPNDSSSHTVLAIKLSAELGNVTLQQIIDYQNLLQNKYQLSPHVFQLLAANSACIFYWMIPKCVVPVITSDITQQRSFFHQNGIVELSIYPGLLYVTDSPMTIGSLSFLNHYVDFDQVILFTVS